MNKFGLFLLFVIFIASFLPDSAVLADTGPKPTMDFSFKQELSGDQIAIISGVLYECDRSDCSDAMPLKELGPQRFTCDATSCSALAYGFSDYHKLEIQFSDDKTRQSNIFKTAGFDSKYTVTVRADDLLVESQFSPVNMLPRTWTITILLLCACILMIGMIVTGIIIFFIRRRSKN
jgi:hypothetical protein